MDRISFDSASALDDVSWQLLVELQENARLSYSELARRVGLTPPAVADRLRRLEEAGIIRGYGVEIDGAKLGFPLLAFMRVTHRGDNCYELGEVMAGFPEVLECHRITGAESYLVKVTVRSVEHLQELIDRIMPFGETVTSVVLSSLVTSRVIRPPAPSRPSRARRTG